MTSQTIEPQQLLDICANEKREGRGEFCPFCAAAETIINLRQAMLTLQQEKKQQNNNYIESVFNLSVKLDKTEQDKDEAEQKLTVLRPGGTYAWKSKYEALLSSLAAHQRHAFEAGWQARIRQEIELFENSTTKGISQEDLFAAYLTSRASEDQRLDTAFSALMTQEPEQESGDPEPKRLQYLRPKRASEPQEPTP